MPRPRQRACLEEGLKLDLNKLIRGRTIVPAARTSSRSIRWSYTYTGDEIAVATLSSNLEGLAEGWLRIQMGGLDQWVALVAQPRHFGGRQWYFVCPASGRRASVLWLPPGASRFACRGAWGRQVGYATQFETRYSRALSAAQRIRIRLGGFEWAGLDGNDPPKPKWMRQATYRRLLERSWAYEDIADEHVLVLAQQLGVLG